MLVVPGVIVIKSTTVSPEISPAIPPTSHEPRGVSMPARKAGIIGGGARSATARNLTTAFSASAGTRNAAPVPRTSTAGSQTDFVCRAITGRARRSPRTSAGAAAVRSAPRRLGRGVAPEVMPEVAPEVAPALARPCGWASRRAAVAAPPDTAAASAASWARCRRRASARSVVLARATASPGCRGSVGRTAGGAGGGCSVVQGRCSRSGPRIVVQTRRLGAVGCGILRPWLSRTAASAARVSGW